MPVTERLEGWLRETGVAFEIFEHAPVHTSEEAARALTYETARRMQANVAPPSGLFSARSRPPCA
jgi:hypothetical protein